MQNNFDTIVVGAGHAGCEAALASARMNKKTLLLATNLDTVAYLACNPSIGGTAKGTIVKEIDALGGEMAKNADSTLIQLRMLNRGKGPAVHCPRAQVDKHKYHHTMKHTVENTENLFLRQAEVTEILQENGEVTGVKTAQNLTFNARTVIVACGVYLNSKIIVGKLQQDSGPNGFLSAKSLSGNLQKLGFEIRRFKTGTPARVNIRSIDFSQLEPQAGEDMPPFSYMNSKADNQLINCHLTFSTKQTHEIIKQNIHQAPLYSGDIKGTGPRYCPSIEDKVMRFADKERHQIFLEKESLHCNEVYVQGVSSSLPADVQQEIYSTIKGLENVEIMRDAYAIEYDCINPLQLAPTLMAKHMKGLFFAGQINGTSGYEEAAAQGLVAGINATKFLDQKEMLVLDRSTSYIGVLIDDLTTKGTNEPYRMMTSRAEYRLMLRQDNADTRLTQIGIDCGLVKQDRAERFLAKQEEIAKIKKTLQQIVKPKDYKDFFEKKQQNVAGAGLTYADMLKRHNISLADIMTHFDILQECSQQALEQAEVDVKYSGYLAKEQEQIAQFLKMEHKKLPSDIDFAEIKGLRLEARQKLQQIMPHNLGQASRISGVSPADITVLIVYLAQRSQA